MPEMSRKHGNDDVAPSTATLARATGLNLAARVTSGVSALGLAVLTTNLLTTHGRGVYAILSAVAGIAATIVEGGTAVLAADLIHKRHQEPVLHGASLAIAANSALVLVLLAGGFSLLTGTSLAVALLCAAAITALLIYSNYEMYLAQAQGDVLRVSLVVIGLDLCPLIASALAALLFEATVTTLIAAWAIAGLVVAATQLADAITRGGLVIKHAQRVGASILRRSVGVSVSNAVSMLFAKIDVLVVAAVLSAGAAGIYSIPVALSTGLLLLSRSVLTATYHSIMTAPPTEVGARLSTALHHSVIVVLVGGCLSLPVVAVGAGLVFGGAYSDIWQPYGVLVLASVGTCVTELLRHFLITGRERQREYVVISAGVLVINGVLAVVGASEFGLVGAAASTTVSYACEALALLIVCSRLLSVPIRSLVVPRRSDLVSYWRVLRFVLARLRGTLSMAR
jgi:O-antigen/teichoic acid export membrane protein